MSDTVTKCLDYVLVVTLMLLSYDIVWRTICEHDYYEEEEEEEVKE